MLMQVTALQIASLKKVNKKSQILLLDKNGSTSKVIARELARKGFRKIRVVQVYHMLYLSLGVHCFACPAFCCFCLCVHNPPPAMCGTAAPVAF